MCLNTLGSLMNLFVVEKKSTDFSNKKPNT